ncbi:hypothetical protein RHSIM_Rhsim03G0146100 [Rhododendron simsii]|uniref:Pentatricopeptide repeat-containing protein n=1 Tax=Rhododendron simsii TaxID=118357 RepID=A0A834LQR6_RHOSS|nr:hypothetical protein RHSIM_Rhsim03G0146100 [Rhododendron simsii]
MTVRLMPRLQRTVALRTLQPRGLAETSTGKNQAAVPPPNGFPSPETPSLLPLPATTSSSTLRIPNPSLHRRPSPHPPPLQIPLDPPPLPPPLDPSQVFQITLCIHNNPHLALRFFLSHSRLLIHQTLTLIHSALLRFPSSDKTAKLFQSLVQTYWECDSAPFVFDLLIKACLRPTRIDQAMEITRMLRSRGISPSVSMCNSEIRLVVKYRGCYAGYDFYQEVFGFCGDGSKSRIGGVFKVVPNVHMFNVIMLGFYRDGLVGNVEGVWGEMEKLGCAASGYSSSILMAAYCEDRKMGEALKLWEEMGIKGLKPDYVAYKLQHYDWWIGEVDSAMMLYKDMCSKGFRPESSTVDAVIRELGGENRGRMEEALKLQAEMVGKGFEPNCEIYSSFIEANMKEGNDELAEMLKKEMFETQMPKEEE